MQRIHGAKSKSKCNQYSLIPAATAWVVIIDVSHSRQHVNWERHVGKINTLSAILGQVPTASIQWGAKTVLRSRSSAQSKRKDPSAPVCVCKSV